MFTVEPNFNYDRINRVITALNIFPQEMKKLARKAFSRSLNLPILQQLRKTPKRRYWTAEDFESDAQRRAFFAKTGGKAYQRTGNYARGFKADIVEGDNFIDFGYVNPVPYARFVGGVDQQFGHVRTGWPHSTAVVIEQRPRAVTVFGQAIEDYIDENIEG